MKQCYNYIFLVTPKYCQVYMYEYSFNKLNQVISHISCIFFKIIFLVYIFYDRDCNNMIRIYVKRLKLSLYVTKHRNVDMLY